MFRRAYVFVFLSGHIEVVLFKGTLSPLLLVDWSPPRYWTPLWAFPQGVCGGEGRGGMWGVFFWEVGEVYMWHLGGGRWQGMKCGCLCHLYNLWGWDVLGVSGSWLRHPIGWCDVVVVYGTGGFQCMVLDGLLMVGGHTFCLYTLFVHIILFTVCTQEFDGWCAWWWTGRRVAQWSDWRAARVLDVPCVVDVRGDSAQFLVT